MSASTEPAAPSLHERLAAILPAGTEIAEAGGICPVQVVCTLPTGEFVYFRARDSISIEVWAAGYTFSERYTLPSSAPCWWSNLEPDYKGTEDPGWMSDEDAAALVAIGLRKYREHCRPEAEAQLVACAAEALAVVTLAERMVSLEDTGVTLPQSEALLAEFRAAVRAYQKARDCDE